jgi:hypothetical protein
MRMYNGGQGGGLRRSPQAFSLRYDFTRLHMGSRIGLLTAFWKESKGRFGVLEFELRFLCWVAHSRRTIDLACCCCCFVLYDDEMNFV